MNYGLIWAICDMRSFLRKVTKFIARVGWISALLAVSFFSSVAPTSADNSGGSGCTTPPSLLDIKLVELAGRPGHQGFFPIQGQPINGSQASARVRLSGGANNVSLALQGESGDQIETIQMFAPPADLAVPGTFYADFVVPSGPFSMSVSGNDCAGNAFTLLQSSSSFITPQMVDVRLTPMFGELSQDLPNRITIRLVNYGPPNVFKVALTSDPAGTATPTTATVSLATGQTRFVDFNFTTTNLTMPMITLTAAVSDESGRGPITAAKLQLPVAVAKEARLSAWLAHREQRLDDHDRGRGDNVTVVWACDNGINASTLMLANEEQPTSVESMRRADEFRDRLRTDSDGERYGRKDDGDADDCTAPSVLKMSFDTTNLITLIRSNTFPIVTSCKESKVTIPITAYDTDGTRLLGSVGVRLKAQNDDGCREDRDEK